MMMRAAMVAVLLAGTAAATEFSVSFGPQYRREPFSGRLLVMFGLPDGPEPRTGPDWFRPQPFFAVDVENLEPGEPVTVGADALGFPKAMPQVEAGRYVVQAVLDRNAGERDFSRGVGNGYSLPATIDFDPTSGQVVPLEITETVAPTPFPEGQRLREVTVVSRLLSDFHGREVTLKAGVALPLGYDDEPTRRYPSVYEIPGFGGTHHGVARRTGFTRVGEVKCVWIVLNPDTALGHHVFADGPNNGPVGRALVEELIPQIERQIRVMTDPETRLLTGHSSGGWSSLWLQVAYPERFGGVWSTAPDPVDFRDFQQVNIYRAGENAFVTPAGERRPIARTGGRPVLWLQDFSDMERVMGHGGQLGSFESVFSPRGEDGLPKPLFDRDSGVVDRAVAAAWETYDIRLVLQRHWDTLGPKLTGKLHVFMGAEDTFYLDGAARLLGQTLRELGSDAEVRIVPGRDHGTLLRGGLRGEILQQMGDRLRRVMAAEAN